MLRGLVLVCEQLYYTHSRSCHGASPSHPSPPLQTQNRCTSLPARFLDTNFAKHSSYQPPCCHHSLSSVLTVRDGAWCAGITMASFTSMNNQQKPPTDDELDVATAFTTNESNKEPIRGGPDPADPPEVGVGPLHITLTGFVRVGG